MTPNGQDPVAYPSLRLQSWAGGVRLQLRPETLAVRSALGLLECPGVLEDMVEVVAGWNTAPGRAGQALH